MRLPRSRSWQLLGTFELLIALMTLLNSTYCSAVQHSAEALLLQPQLQNDSTSTHDLQHHQNYSTTSLLPRQFPALADRPSDCPPCFNCNLPNFSCLNSGNCTQSSGRCSCHPGFGGLDCGDPLCGSLALGKDRAPRTDATCACDDGWEGINCNVCKTDNACNALMPEGKDGVCYRQGVVQKENHQMCDVTNKKIVDQLKERKPQVTFSCNAENNYCNFQFWVGQNESFYCGLDTCTSESRTEPNKNVTKYSCEHIECSCIHGRFLCGEAGAVDIGDFLKQSIKGPATFTTTSTEGGSPDDGSVFSEQAMNNLISSVFGDPAITLSCNSGECLYKTLVPGFEKPVKKINTPLIAGVIAGCALVIVAVILVIWYWSRKSSKDYNIIHLTEEDDEDAAKLMMDHKPAALHFENVMYALKGKQILSGIQGGVQPGQLMAIMGASGAGKSTFLDILARKNKRGAFKGQFYVNGETISDDDFRDIIGFVDQDDTMLPTLTVHETILDSALLRLPKHMSYAAKLQRVEDVERQLGIYHIRDQLIGSEEGNGRGVSGGEKRRVGIACELVTSPSILFLDEPTSGLDAFNAYNVVECLVTLAKTYNRTVILTIHQPRSNIVALFDQLILLSKGKTVYSGPFSSCQGYFDSIGYACPPGFNIADYLIDLTMHVSADRQPFEEDLLEASLDKGQTRTSSTMALKSLASASNASIEENTDNPTTESLLRPRYAREGSLVKRRQDAQLFTRRAVGAPNNSLISYTDDSTPSLPAQSQNGSLSGLSKASTSARDDPHDLPPDSPSSSNLDALVSRYMSSNVSTELRNEIREAMTSAAAANGRSTSETSPNRSVMSRGSASWKRFQRVGLLRQFVIISGRTWKNLYRNPMLMLTHYAISIVLAVFLGFLFYGLTDDIAGFQNRLGLFFFVLALFGFSTLTSLTVFGPERLLFVRERAKGYYHPIAYYLAKVIFDVVPLRLIPPIILGVIIYPMTGLVPQWGHFFIFILFLVLFNLAAAAICLCVGIVFKNGGVANLVGSLVMLFSLLFSGFLLNYDTIPWVALWLQYLSIFHFSFEGVLVNEVKYLSLTDHKYGLDIEVPGSAILSSFGFNTQSLWRDAIGLGAFAAGFLVIAYLAMHFLLVERR